MRQKNLAVAWTEYNKAYDMVPRSWIVECLRIVWLSEQFKQFLPKI